MTTTQTQDREIVQHRVLNAPRELVFQVWTEPQHIVQWWGPNGFTNTIEHMDVKPGGSWKYTMHGPDGTDFPNVISYLEVIKPEKLVYIHGSSDAQSPETDPHHFHVEVTFEDAGDGKTRLTMRSVFQTAAARDHVVREFGAIEGGKQTLDKLEAFLGKFGK